MADAIRVLKCVSAVKRLLLQYNFRGINTPEIFDALNKGQIDIVLKENLIQKEIKIAAVEDQAEYDIAYTEGEGDNKVVRFIVKIIRSIRFPQTWGKMPYKNNQQFDEILNTYGSLTYPYCYTIRNDQIVVHAAPSSVEDIDDIILQTYLKEPINSCDDENEFEIPSCYDIALIEFALWFLLPVNHPNKETHKANFEIEKNKYSGENTNQSSASRVPDCKW